MTSPDKKQKRKKIFSNVEKKIIELIKDVFGPKRITTKPKLPKSFVTL